MVHHMLTFFRMKSRRRNGKWNHKFGEVETYSADPTVQFKMQPVQLLLLYFLERMKCHDSPKNMTPPPNKTFETVPWWIGGIRRGIGGNLGLWTRRNYLSYHNFVIPICHWRVRLLVYIGSSHPPWPGPKRSMRAVMHSSKASDMDLWNGLFLTWAFRILNKNVCRTFPSNWNGSGSGCWNHGGSIRM